KATSTTFPAAHTPRCVRWAIRRRASTGSPPAWREDNPCLPGHSPQIVAGACDLLLRFLPAHLSWTSRPRGAPGAAAGILANRLSMGLSLARGPPLRVGISVLPRAKRRTAG